MSERLLIREFVPNDAVLMCDFALDPDFWLHTSLRVDSTEALDQFVQDVVAEQRLIEREFYSLALTERSTNTLIGFVKTGIISHANQVGMLGYAIGKPYAGRGFATEAGAAMLPFAFVALGLHRLTADCDANNPASSRVLEKLGFTLEGRLRESRQVDGARIDSLVYGMLAEDFITQGF